MCVNGRFCQGIQFAVVRHSMEIISKIIHLQFVILETDWTFSNQNLVTTASDFLLKDADTLKPKFIKN